MELLLAATSNAILKSLLIHSAEAVSEGVTSPSRAKVARMLWHKHVALEACVCLFVCVCFSCTFCLDST